VDSAYVATQCLSFLSQILESAPRLDASLKQLLIAIYLAA